MRPTRPRRRRTTPKTGIQAERLTTAQTKGTRTVLVTSRSHAGAQLFEILWAPIQFRVGCVLGSIQLNASFGLEITEKKSD